jgi:hypothetical protein
MSSIEHASEKGYDCKTLVTEKKEEATACEVPEGL